MASDTLFKPAHLYEDERGRLITLFNSGEWAEVNCIETRAGVVRGGQYHLETHEAVYMIDGAVTVVLTGRPQPDLEGDDLALR